MLTSMIRWVQVLKGDKYDMRSYAYERTTNQTGQNNFALFTASLRQLFLRRAAR